jgi:peptide/nickel transport system substrate-binding protein
MSSLYETTKASDLERKGDGMKKAGYIFTTIVLMSGLLLGIWKFEVSAAPSPTPIPERSQKGGVMKILMANVPGTFGYPPNISGLSVSGAQPCLEPLTDFDVEGNFRPGLTTAYKIAPDGRSITFTLRKGVTFHDGTDFNARAVKWNLDASMAAKQLGSDAWTSVDVIDDYTVRLNLSRFDSTIIYMLTRSAGLMVSPTAVQKNGVEWANLHPVGTGPFKFKSYERNVLLKYERFENYWRKDMPYLDGVEFIYIKDPMVQQAALLGEKGHMIFRAIPKQVPEFKAKGFEIIAPRPTHIDSLIPDSSREGSPLADKKVREAIEYAIDREAIARALGYGLWAPAYQIAPPSSSVTVAGIEGRRYNPNKSRELLKEAGYSSGLKIKIIAEVGRPEKDVLVALQEQLKKVGVECQLEIVTRGRYEEYREARGWVNAYIYSTMGIDQIVYSSNLERWLSPSGRTYVSVRRPAGFSDLYADAVAAKTRETYVSRVQQMIKLVYDEAAIFPLWTLVEAPVVNPSLRDTGFLSTGHHMQWSPYAAWLKK